MKINSHHLNTGGREIDVHSENPNILCHFCVLRFVSNGSKDHKRKWLLSRYRLAAARRKKGARERERGLERERASERVGYM